MAQIVWDLEALEDLAAIAEYIERDSPKAAKRLVQRIVGRVEQLVHGPLTGGFLEEDSRQIYRQLIQGNYRIIYRCQDDDVVIVAVYHAARILPPDRIP